MNTVIKSPTEIKEKSGWTVFLAGPMHASPRGWRENLVKTATAMGLDNITFISPRYTTMRMPSNQAQWETQGLRMCDIALFWIPNKDPKAEMGTRVYAETTRMEYAENIARGKKIIIGIDTEISGERRMKFLARRYGIKKVHNTLEDCLAELKKWIESARPKVHHIAAPGFDNAEQLAKHPYFVDALAMNQTLMERWNKVVHPGDKVYVAGDFGNREWMPLLNGEIIVQETQDEQFIYTHLI